MALSYYSNWECETFQHELDSDIINILAQPQADHDELLPQDLWNIDSLFEPDDLFYPENAQSFVNETIITENPNSLQYDLSSELNSIAPEVVPFSLQQEFEPNFHYPKRQKPCVYEEMYSSFFNEPLVPIMPSPCLNFQDYESIIMPPLPDFPSGPPVYNPGKCESVVVKKETTTLSAQSIAARQRRRKITDKTHELGKLIPGGHKMNTAEMLQAAHKYIKYMQAQVGILEFMDSYNQEKKEAYESYEEILHGLLESPLIQEKLYSTEKCLVPKKFVQELSNDREIVESNRGLLPILKEER